VYILIGISMVITAAMLTSFVFSAGLSVLWPLLKRVARKLSAAAESRFWFTVGLAPAMAGLWVALLIAGPSYIIHEPRNGEESMGLPLIALTLFALTLFAVSLSGCVAVFVKAWKVSDLLRKHSHRLDLPDVANEIYELPETSNTFTVVGVFHPTMFVSRAVLNALNAVELSSVLAHELAHMRSQHNGLTLILRFACQLSGNPVFIRLVHSEWVQAIELEADAAAIHSPEDALELGSALVKVARLPLVVSAATGAGCDFVDTTCNSALGRRIGYLRAAAAGEIRTSRTLVIRVIELAVCGIFPAVIGIASTPAILSRAHNALELLMR